MENVSREKALALLRKYNKEPFHNSFHVDKYGKEMHLLPAC